MKLAEISIKRSILAAMLIAALMVFGFFSLPRLGVDLYPSVDFPIVTTTVVYPGGDPATMETKVADKIEEALQSLGGVKRMTSRNSESVSQVILEFELEVNGDKALQEVRDKIATIERNLPDGIEPPVVQKFDTGAAPVLKVALASDLPIEQLTEISKDVVKQKVQQVQGVGSVDIIGGRERQIKINVDPRKLVGHGITVDDVANAIKAQNIELPAGYFESGGQELTVKTKGEVHSVSEIEEILIPGRNTGLKIKDVADVVDGVEDARSASFLNGESAVSLVVRKQSGANTVSIAKGVRKTLDKLTPELEKRGIAVAVPSDNSVFVSNSINSVIDDLIIGAVLTVIIILVFLHDIRATFIAALAIPTSVVATFTFMEMMGFTFNNLTMLALSLSIGILVDDAIVVIENIYRHLEMGKGKRQAALDATSEIGFAVIATTMSIAAVFVPVAYMQGIVGRFFFQFGMTVSAAVLISMLVSFTLTPMLASRIMRSEHAPPSRGVFAMIFAPIGKLFRPFKTGFNRMFAGVERVYAAILRWCLRFPWTTLAMAITAMVGSVFLVTQVKSEFIPNDDRSEFAINIEMPTGTRLGPTIATTRAISEDVRQNLPDVQDTFTTIGGGAQGQVNRAKITVTLTKPHDRDFSQFDAMNWVRERMADVQGAIITVEKIDPIGGDSGFRSQPIQYSIRGNNLDEVVAAADALKAELAKTGKFVDLDTTYRGGKPELAIHVDRNKAADQGVPVATIASTVRSLMAGDTVSTLKDGASVYDIILQMPEDQRQNLESLANLKVRSARGELIDLANLVTLEREEGPSEIERQDRMRQVLVLADLKGISTGEAQKIVEDAVARVVPEHLTTGWMGNTEMMIDSFISMLLALGLAVILVYMILAAQFDSLIQPITIMVSLPLSVIGAFGGLYLTDMSLNLFSFIGIIMLMGLVTKTAILLVDFANSEREAGKPLFEALVAAGVVRIRPIFMTAGATIFGMLPVAMALGEGGQARAPMAVCVIGGMITSTALTLVVIPVVYLLFDRMVTNMQMSWVSRKFFGIEPGSDSEALDVDVSDVDLPDLDAAVAPALDIPVDVEATGQAKTLIAHSQEDAMRMLDALSARDSHVPEVKQPPAQMNVPTLIAPSKPPHDFAMGDGPTPAFPVADVDINLDDNDNTDRS